MHVNEVKYFDAIPIDSYGPGFFRIEGKILKSGIVCSGPAYLHGQVTKI